MTDPITTATAAALGSNVELNIGDKLRDNDPRMPNRILTVVALGPRTEAGLQSVRAKGLAPPTVTISTRRIHADGKKRRSGFDLILKA